MTPSPAISHTVPFAYSHSNPDWGKKANYFIGVVHLVPRQTGKVCP